eukprot:UN11147
MLNIVGKCGSNRLELWVECKAESFPSKNRRQEASFEQIRRI